MNFAHPYKNVDNEYVDIIPDGKVKLSEVISKWIYLGTYPEPSATAPEMVIRQSFHLENTVTNWAQGDKCEIAEQFMVLQTNAPHPPNLYDAAGEDTTGECSDKIDNDYDNLIDGEDPSCN